MPRVAETFKSVINEMIYGTDFKLINSLHAENANLNHKDLNTRIDKPETRWNTHLLLYDTLTSRVKPSSFGQLSHCWWRSGIFDEYHRCKAKNHVGWRIVMHARIGFRLQVTAMLGFHSLYDWCFQTMWLFSGAPEDPKDETVMEKHGTQSLYSALKSSMHAILTEDHDAQPDVADRMIYIATRWTFRRWSETNLMNGDPLVWTPKENAYRADPELTEEEQAKLKTLVKRYTSKGTSGVWRVHRWQLACCSLVLGDTEDRHDISGQWSDQWPLETWVDNLIIRWLRVTYLPMLVNEPVEYPKPVEDEASNEALPHEPEWNNSSLPPAPPLQKVELFCPLPGLVRHLKWWLAKIFVGHLDIVYMYMEMGNDECTEMQLKFHDSPNPSVFATTPTVGGTGLNLTAANHVVITLKFWVVNEQCQAFAWVVRLGQNRVPHTWLLNTGPRGHDNKASNLHLLSGIGHMRVLHGLMSRPSITTSMIYCLLECQEDHTM